MFSRVGRAASVQRLQQVQRLNDAGSQIALELEALPAKLVGEHGVRELIHDLRIDQLDSHLGNLAPDDLDDVVHGRVRRDDVVELVVEAGPVQAEGASPARHRQRADRPPLMQGRAPTEIG